MLQIQSYKGEQYILRVIIFVYLTFETGFMQFFTFNQKFKYTTIE